MKYAAFPKYVFLALFSMGDCKGLVFLKNIFGKFDLGGNVTRNIEMRHFRGVLRGLLKIIPNDIFTVVPKERKDVGNHD